VTIILRKRKNCKKNNYCETEGVLIKLCYSFLSCD